MSLYVLGYCLVYHVFFFSFLVGSQGYVSTETSIDYPKDPWLLTNLTLMGQENGLRNTVIYTKSEEKFSQPPTMHFQPIENMTNDDHITRAEVSYQVEVAAAASSHDAFDDVFGSGPPSPAREHQDYAAPEGSHPSDIDRLRSEHATAGYREGLTVSKETSIQAGFDEGFSLGASIGLRAGQVLGALEGIAAAVVVRGQDNNNINSSSEETAQRLLSEARRELTVAEIFSPKYWKEDGNWRFEVGKGDDETVFMDVADAHPLVKKWAQVVDEQIELWGIDRTLLDDETGQRLDEPVTLSSGAAPVAKKPLDW